MAAPRLFELSPERLELLRRRRRAEGVAAAEEAIPRRPEGEPPPSFAQERLWFLDRLAAGGARLAIPAALVLDGPLDAAALAGALADLVARHEPLRTRFRAAAGGPRLEVGPPERVPRRLRLPVADLAALPAARRRGEAQRLVAAFERLRFDLGGGRLLAALLARLEAGRHALVLAVHHVAADGWSMAVLFRDLAAAYTRRARGGTPPRREPPVRYGDWAAWQRRRLSGAGGETEVAWWRERLEGAPRVLDLPADRPRSAAGAPRGGSVRTVLPPPLADRLRAAGRALPAGEATPFMVLLALLAVLLSRWSGQRDLVVGTPVAGRTRRETEGLVGLFLNHLALRLDLSGGPSFGELLARARQVALDAYAHQELPFERLLEAMVVPRDLATTPVFQVFLNLLSFPPPPSGLEGLAVSPLAPPRPPARFDLTLYADDGGPGGAIALDLVYDARRFDRPRMEEALRQLAALAEQAAADPGRPVAVLSLLTAAARRALPDPRRRQDDGWPGPVHAAVEAWAAQHPARPAVIAADGAAVSYGRLAAAVRGLAARLAAAGVRRGDVVAVHAWREPALAAAVLAVHRAGAAFLLLDPAHPAPRNALCTARAAPRALLRLAGAPPWPPEVAAAAPDAARLELPPLTESGEGFAELPGDAVPVGPGDLAYVAFTSGSTGEPKGVLGLHRSLTHFLPWQAEAFSLGPADRVSLLSGLAHDPLHRDLFTPLWVGGAVAMPDAERFAAPGYLAGWMAAAGVTVMHGTPSLLRLVAEVPDTGAAPPRLGALRWAFLVGEALRGDDLARLAALAPRALAVNLYGSTESQRAVTWCRAEAAGTAAAVVPLGRGMPDVQLLVMAARDGADGPCGVGEIGELHLRSPHLAAGYRGRAADTAAAFVPDPFGGTPGGRLYRTGDLGRFRPDGRVEPLGRRDRQVKVRGVRVEPAEVEAVLAGHPAVAEAAVVAFGEAAATRLVAYWTPARRGGGDGSTFGHGGGDGSSGGVAAALRDHLAARLPAALVPAELVRLAVLPRTPNGKLDRAALPAPSPPGDPAAGEPPATPAEELLAGIWRQVLGAGAVYRGDDFFARGGHSLALTRVLARVREVFGVELPVRRAFEAPVLAAQAAAIEAAALEATAAEAVADEAPLRPRPRRPGAPAADAPLSFAQRRLWFLDRLAPGSTAYTLSAAVDLDGPLRPGALAAGLAAVVRRHEALRTRFPAPRGVPVQRVAPPPAPRPLPFVDLAALPPAPARRAADRLAAAAARRRFDLARGPLLGAVLLRRAEERWRLLVSVHHAVADGGSLGVVAAELGQLYSAAVEGRPPRLPRLQVQYADWAAWQRRRLDGEALEGPLAWWRQRLDGLPPALGLPTDRPYGPGADLRGGRIERRLPPPLAAALDGLGRGAGATRYMLLLAALAVVLSRWSGQRDLAVGSPESGRARRETENLVGLFLNLLVLRLDLAGEPSFAELLGRVRETVLDAFAHREVPFERLLETLAPERDPARPPLVEVLLNVFAPPRRAPRFAGLDARLVPPVEREARFPLTLYAGAGGGEDAGPDAGEGGGGPLLALVYRRALFDRVRAEELLDQVVLVLEAAAADPARPVAALPALTARARAVLADPAAPLPGPSPQPVARRFAAVAAAHAARPAVVQGGRAWTYGELAAAVERLAAALRRAGVGTGEAVAVGGGPSFSLVAAALAVLRAGGVLLLLDPALPSARRRAVAAAAGARLLVAPPGAAALGLAHLRLTEEAVPHAGLPVLEGPPPRRHPPEAAYVVFTSGSSGEPKGVVGAQLGLAHFLDWQRRTFGIGPGDRVAQLTALSFDVVLRDLLLPLTSGAALVLPEDAALRLDPERVCGWLDAHGVTVLHAVPALARPWLEARPRPPLAALRWVFFAGEPLPAALVDAWRRAFPSSPASETGGNGGIVNLYGPTETTLARCAWRVPEPPAPGVQPVGRALPDSQALVLRAGRRCGLGEVGEIVLRTPCRSLGYLDPTSAGARRFAPSPFREDPGDLLYATGDLGRFRPDGVLEILGREDRQVKLRGVRVEPAEVEAALTAHPAVGAAAVALRGPQLVAWVVPAAGEAVEPRFLRAHLARRLPAALVPSRFVVLERLPTGPTGKLDRGALPAPPAAGEESPVAPRDEVEAALAEIFGEVLGAERVGVRDGFFALGGHSLLAVPLLSRIERRFGRRLPLAALFERPTVEELAELLRAPRRRRRDASPLVTLQPGDGRPPLVLVHPGGGGVLCYAELARALGPEQPVLALQSVGLDGCEAPLDSVEAMAGRYLAALAEVQPAGPYRLGGWSFGGRVAFEMAGRLRGAGEAVALVALLDITPHPSPGPARPAGGGNGAADDGAAPPPDDDPELLARALADAFPLAADDLRGLGDREQLDALLEAARAAGRLPAGVEPRRAEALFRVFKANMAAARAFRPRPYPGPVVLVRAAGSDRFAFPPGDPHDPDPSGGWAALADSVELAVVPGDHHTMVRPPHVEALAAALRRALES